MRIVVELTVVSGYKSAVHTKSDPAVLVVVNLGLAQRQVPDTATEAQIAVLVEQALQDYQFSTAAAAVDPAGGTACNLALIDQQGHIGQVDLPVGSGTAQGDMAVLQDAASQIGAVGVQI